MLQGVQMVREEMTKMLDRFGIRRMDVKPGEAFDPNRHEAIGQDFNIGTPREVETTLGLARWVARLVPGATIQMKEIQRAEVRGRVPVIDKARRVLQFEPKVDLAEGLRQTLDWYRSQPKA